MAANMMVYNGSMDGKDTHTHTNYINKIKSALSFHVSKDESLTSTNKVHNGKNIYFNHHTGSSKQIFKLAKQI